MFVKIENYLDTDNEEKELLLNLDMVESVKKYNRIYNASIFFPIDKYINGYVLITRTSHHYWLNEEQYNALCQILTKKL